MKFSTSRTHRLGLAVAGLACLSIVACTPTPPQSKTVQSSPQSNSSPNPTIAAPTNDKEKFVAILGTQKDGWLPKVLIGKNLKKGLSPEETGKMIPGAEKVSDLGFTKVTADNIAGLKNYEFYYMRDKTGKFGLTGIKLYFDPSTNQSYQDLVNVLVGKYGEVNPEDVKKQILVWVTPEFKTAQLMKEPTDFGSYVLNVDLEN
jgi:hypothetical protein